MTNSSTLREVRKIYDKHPKLAFSLLLDVVQDQNEKLEAMEVEKYRAAKTFAEQLQEDNKLFTRPLLIVRVVPSWRFHTAVSIL